MNPTKLDDASEIQWTFLEETSLTVEAGTIGVALKERAEDAIFLRPDAPKMGFSISDVWTGELTGLCLTGESGLTGGAAFVSMGRSWLTVTKDYRSATIDLNLCDYRVEGDNLIVSLKDHKA